MNEAIRCAAFQSEGSTRHNGDFTTFSPEFLGTKDAARVDFVIGNLKQGPIELALANPIFQRLQREIDAGVAKCERGCQYFSVRGGERPPASTVNWARWMRRRPNFANASSRRLPISCSKTSRAAPSRKLSSPAASAPK